MLVTLNFAPSVLQGTALPNSVLCRVVGRQCVCSRCVRWTRKRYRYHSLRCKWEKGIFSPEEDLPFKKPPLWLQRASARFCGWMKP